MARLLVIDDEESLCKVLKDAFQKKGHLVETVTSGQAAKKRIESQSYDLIISDIRMPDLTGIELLEHALKIRNPAPFILMTAVPTVTTAIQAVNLGAYRYVVKTDALVEELNLTVDSVLAELAWREENLRRRSNPLPRA
jgi:DNA-binding NtrC family response regulator